MDEVINITAVYVVILLLALFIERLMEVLAATWNFIEWKAGMHEYWNKQAEKLKRKYESSARSQILSRAIIISPLARQIRYATRYKKKGHSEKLVIISGEMIRKSVIATVSRILASILGIVFCLVAGINLITVFQSQLPNIVGKLTNWSPALQVIISGVVIGLGAEPVHNLIANIEKRRAAQAKKAELEKALG